MDKVGLPIIIYAGTEYVLSHWCGTNGRRLLKRMWLSTTHSFAAATIIKKAKPLILFTIVLESLEKK